MLKTKTKQIKREKHHFDASGKTLGRLACQVAALLMGKNKPYFVPHLDCGDSVEILNAAKIRVTGQKEEQKIYTRYSGFPGGLKQIPLKRMRAEHPERLIISAVTGMLPKNKLRKQRLKRLIVYPGEKYD